MFKFIIAVLAIIPSITFAQTEQYIDKKVPIIHYKIADDETENKGTVIIAHGCAGVMVHERNIAQMFRQKNYHTVLVDSWTYRGFPSGPGENSMCRQRFDPALRLEEVYKAAAWVRTQPWHKGKVYLLGFSHGGMVALEASLFPRSKGIDKAVSFYPFCHPHYHREPLIPTQVHIGSDDDWTPAARCRGMYTSMFKKYKYGEYYEYPNTTHSFDIGRDFTVRGLGANSWISDRVIKYNRETTRTAYARVFEFFNDE